MHFFSNTANLDLCGGVCPCTCEEEEEEGERERGCVGERVLEPSGVFL